jgi:hypothetical protein
VTGFHFGGTSTNNALIPPGQSFQTLSQTSTFHSDYRSGVEIGALVSAGVRFHTGRFALAPETRYTRWGDNNTNITPRNEAAILLGISF